MTSEALYNLLMDYVRADGRGKTLSQDEFNNMAPMVNDEVMSFVVNNQNGDQDMADRLNYLKVINQSVPISSGVGDLPSDYKRLLGEPRVDGDPVVVADVVTPLEYSWRVHDELTQPTATHPVVVFGGGDASAETKKVYCYPASEFSSAILYIDYLKEPPVPFLDYYINDTTYVVTYMDAGATGVSIPSGSTYRDGTAGPVSKDSSTVDPIWEGDELNLFIYLFLTKLGITVNDMNLVQYGITNQAKLEANE